MKLLVSLGLIAGIITPIFAVPSVDLLIDHGFQRSGVINLRKTLASVSQRKGKKFHFGSTLNITIPHPGWPEDVFSSFFDHVVAENGCKWGEVEREPGKSNLTECFDVPNFADKLGNSFRGHNTFWHTHLPVRNQILYLSVTSQLTWWASLELAPWQLQRARTSRERHSNACAPGD